DHARAGIERPAMLAHIGMDDGHADHLLQAFQGAHDQCAVRPRTGKGYIQVIAPGFGAESAAAAWPGATVGRDPVPEPGVAANEAAAGATGVVPLIMPFSVYQKSHVVSLLMRPAGH